MSNPLNRPHKIEVTRDANGEFRWRRHAGNSRIISNSAEGYKEKRNMWEGLELANPDHESLKIVDHTLTTQEEGPSPSS